MVKAIDVEVLTEKEFEEAIDQLIEYVEGLYTKRTKTDRKHSGILANIKREEILATYHWLKKQKEYWEQEFHRRNQY